MLANIKAKITNNTAALLVSTALSNILRLGSNLLLSRLLFPEAFGIAGIVSSIFFVMELFSDLGFHAYIVRHREGDKETFLDTLWTIKFLRGIFLTGVMAVLSWPIAYYIGSPEIQPAILVSSLIMFIIGIEPLSDIISDRRNHVAKPLYVDLLAYSISTVCVVLMAFYTKSYWALIAGLFIHHILRLIFGYTLYENSRRTFRIERSYLPEFFDFAKIIIPSSIITIFLAQGDKAIIARTLPLAELGLYYIALNFSGAALHIAITYPRRVLYPILAETFRNTPEQLRDVFYQRKTLILCGFSFLTGGLAGSADLFFDLLYDDRYQSAAIFLSVMLINPILCTVSYPAETCLVATGRTSVALSSNIMRLIWIAPTSYLGYTLLGNIGVILAFSSIELLPAGFLLWKLKQAKLLELHKEGLKILAAIAGFIIFSYLSQLISTLIS
jgi:O-antigen/teichoic acid export membrane protein